jgi:hypothetical protein
MEEIIKTIQLEYEKSSFLIDLVKHQNGKLFISINQIVHKENGGNISQEIKINPAILDDILSTLSNFKKEIEKTSKVVSKAHISEDKNSEIIKRYLKGIEIKDLALQFDCSVEIIEQILTNNNIVVMSNKIPYYEKYYLKNKK